ncbi:hypothetical protein C4565_02255 [Candidatus Parcubacteria bacterium]|jgi:hypothetical protein|nr:MAG: hypothetical protein C4565_02255 [Candidatus Parcubacteria bacterium]
MKETIEKIQEEKNKLKREVRNQTLTLIITSFGLVAGLAWNEAVKACIELFFPPTGSGVIAKVIYAVFITFIVVLASSTLTKMKRIEE